MSHTKRIIVAGGGRVGLRTARELADRGHEIVLIEKESAQSDRVADERVAMVIEGDATSPAILEQADPERADAIAALTDEAGTNLAICLAARQVAPNIRTLARTDAGTEDAYDEIADATILPQELSAATAADILSGEEVRTIIGDHHDLEILEIEVGEGAPVAGHTLDEISLPSGSLVISDRDRTRIARADTELQAGERYIVGVESGVVEEVLSLFRG
ncbi:potassium channel family protein [Haloplanus aerogenes]|uniref:Trk system potassium uptake protein TrkA n=1 Tax=Haloplanus aerogenes TaxID=660522 RepID=A0A3M0DTF2_9EURY|nr:TrkA family potassium uptake protein [Haloplanus aerogenes]AZH25647.1 TrkA family potassium uptake protein [Haloplanus aerogenes]RMB25374.1 trk system potassium uptake protein TrkA [Haloplanus aerogenes]